MSFLLDGAASVISVVLLMSSATTLRWKVCCRRRAGEVRGGCRHLVRVPLLVPSMVSGLCVLATFAWRARRGGGGGGTREKAGYLWVV